MKQYICLKNKKERALQTICAGTLANRWMGTSRTICIGLTARYYNTTFLLKSQVFALNHEKSNRNGTG